MKCKKGSKDDQNDNRFLWLLTWKLCSGIPLPVGHKAVQPAAEAIVMRRDNWVEVLPNIPI